MGAPTGENDTVTKREHVPAPGRAAGLKGTALCGRWATFATGDHALLRRIAATGGAHYCKECLSVLLEPLMPDNVGSSPDTYDVDNLPAE